MPAPAPGQSGISLTVMVSLRGIRPAVWRRLSVPADLGLLAFHSVLQEAFGWADSHLHAFVQGRRRFEVFEPGYEAGRRDDVVSDERTVRLGELLRAKGDALAYQYDMGDFREHAVVVEEVAAAPAGAHTGFANHKGRKLCRAGVAVDDAGTIVAAMMAGDMHVSPPDTMDRVAAALVGALMIGVIRNALNLLNVDIFFQLIAIGVVIVLAVEADVLRGYIEGRVRVAQAVRHG